MVVVAAISAVTALMMFAEFFVISLSSKQYDYVSNIRIYIYIYIYIYIFRRTRIDIESKL